MPSRGAVPLHTEAAGAAPPDAFGPFRVLHQVGAGALGPVFRAFDPDRDRLVAVKLFRLDLPPDRMHQLVTNLQRLAGDDVRHPSIAAAIAAGTDGSVVYLAQDFVSAESLDVVIRDQGAVPFAHALLVTAQLAGALDFAAVVNVHHGALHPRDVLLTDDDTRLTGLGVTRALEQVGVTPPVRRPYTAPERIAGGEWDQRADIFSLAALVHEMLWGRRVAGLGADAARSLTDLAGGHLPALQTVFARALAEDPADRFDTALDFAVALEAAFPDVVVARTTAVDAQESRGARALAANGAVQGAAPREAGTAANEDRRTTDPELIDPVSTDLGEPDLRAVDAKLDAHATLVNPSLDPDATLLKGRSTTDEGRLPTDDALVGDLLNLSPTEVVGDFELRIDEPDRGRVAAPEPEIARAETRSDRASASRPPMGAQEPQRPRHSSPLFDADRVDEPSAGSSRAWPVAAALIVGLIAGFGSGYLAGGRQGPAPAVATVQTRTPPSVVSPATPSTAAPAAPAGRAATESPGTPQRTDAVSGLPSSRDASADTSGTARGVTGRSDAVRVPPPPAARPSTLPPAEGRSGQSREASGTGRGDAAGERGRLLVRSTPSGATVFVDGRERGRTPVTIGDLARGTHRIRIARDGYETEDRRIVITPAQPAESLAVTLDRRRSQSAPAVTRSPIPRTPATVGTSTGAVAVESRPAGASVFLDGALVGTTPVTMSQVAAGEHVIRLEHNGYRRWSSSILVVGGARNRVTASLER